VRGGLNEPNCALPSSFGACASNPLRRATQPSPPPPSPNNVTGSGPPRSLPESRLDPGPVDPTKPGGTVSGGPFAVQCTETGLGECTAYPLVTFAERANFEALADECDRHAQTRWRSTRGWIRGRPAVDEGRPAKHHFDGSGFGGASAEVERDSG
jgi:hypothetical protein